MDFQDVICETDGPVAVITLNRPRYRNAQSWRLLDELDQALDLAIADNSIKVAVVKGAGESFSAGHDLGTPEQAEERRQRGLPTQGIAHYNNFRRYNLDLTIKWRNLPKPTIAVVHGYCIYGGWMIASAMDLIFASEDALFLAGLFEYFSVPWDVPPRVAKDLVFESRFLTAQQAKELHMVSRVYPTREDLEREALAYAHRVAENSALTLRLAKLSINKMLDGQGFSNNMESAFHDYWVAANPGRPADPAREAWERGETPRRLPGVDLALRRLREQQSDSVET